jgi:hypothetical protein
MRSDEVWANVGVVQALIHRSLQAGLEMYHATEAAIEKAVAGRGIRGLIRRLTGVRLGQPMSEVLTKYPGLEDFLAGEVQGRWEEGVEALGLGELDLGLFSRAETSAALEKARSLGIKLTEKAEMLVADAESAEEKVQAFALWMISYVDELATPQRLAQMQAKLDDFAADAAPSQLAFLAMLNEEFQEADASDQLRPLLARALLGEAQNAMGTKAQVAG